MSSGPSYDPRTGSLLVDEDGFGALVALADGRSAPPEQVDALTGAGVLVGGRPRPEIKDGLHAVLHPVCELTLQRGDRAGQGWVDGRLALLIVPAGDERRRVIVVPTSFLPDALARLNDLGPLPPAPRPEPLAVHGDDLARWLAGRGPSGAGPRARLTRLGGEEANTGPDLVARLREHWRVESRWPPAKGSPGLRSVEVLDEDLRLWLVVPGDPLVELWPSSPTEIWRLLTNLLPDINELAVDRSPE